MMTRTLIIGNRRYSSWSLRAFLALKHAKLDFDIKCEPFSPDYAAMIGAKYPPARSVPALVDGDLVIAQSMAIGLYAHQCNPSAGLIPNDLTKAGVCYDLSAEMLSSFQNLRSACSVDEQLSTKFAMTDAVAKDLARLELIWGRALKKFGGEFLVGDFSLADAMFTPVAIRIRGYQLPINAECQAYCQRLLARPDYIGWRELALQETYDFH